MVGRLTRNRKMLFLFVLLLLLAAHFGNIKKYFQFDFDVSTVGSKTPPAKPDSIQAESRGFKFHGGGSREFESTSSQETVNEGFEFIYNSETSEAVREKETTAVIPEEIRGNNKRDSENEFEHLRNMVKSGLSPPHRTMLENLTFTELPSNDFKNSPRKAPNTSAPPDLSEDQQVLRIRVLKQQKTVSMESFNQEIKDQEQGEDNNLPDKDSLSSQRMRMLRDNDNSSLDHPAGRTQLHSHDDVITGELLSRNASILEAKPSKPKNVSSASIELDKEDDSVKCPYFRIGVERYEETENVTCVPHTPSERDCQKARKFYELYKQPLRCSTKPQASLCSFKQTWRSSTRERLSLKCDLSQCGKYPMHVIALDPSTGILKDHQKWHKFASSKGLETFLSSFVIATSVQGFNFCFLVCHSKNTKDYIEQILYFPPIMKKPRSRLGKTGFDVNILVLDSVSRPHFYRSLPKSVDSLRALAREDHIARTNVLDFELFQSSAAHTFQNIRALMSGKNGSAQDKTYGIDVLFGNFRRKEYYTVLQEDSCWFDSWGSLFTNNLYQGKKPSNKLEFYERWQTFQTQVKEYFVDDYGLSHTPCEVFKRYNTTNQFNQPKKVCFAGRVFAEFFLDYVESVYVASKTSGSNQPILSYTHLNIGHEVTGRRIRQIDKHLSEFLRKMAKYQDTLTIVLSDHGPKTTEYSFHTMEGRIEMYNPFLFMIIPKGVAHVLKKERMKALKINQRRLISTLDLHEALMSIGDLPEANPYRQSLFTVIPANRTCNDFNLRPSAMCKCKGWEERFSNKDDSFLWMAELGLGTLNNQIQEQYLSVGQHIAGFGKCQRLIGKGIAKVRRRTHGNEYITTMDLLVKPKSQIFEIQVRYPKREKGSGVASLSFSQRITIYRHFSRCVDRNVSVSLCVCQFEKSKQDQNTKWTLIRNKQDVLDVIAESQSFHATPKVQDLHNGCLLLMTRKHGPSAQTKVIEASNTCGDRLYTINVTAERIEDVIMSRELPFTLTLLPRTIHFLFSVYHLQEPYNFKVLVSYEYEEL